jgi:predicted nucleotide-binding protein (sugar kinase/HSP70/actin superfamily)
MNTVKKEIKKEVNKISNKSLEKLDNAKQIDKQKKLKKATKEISKIFKNVSMANQPKIKELINRCAFLLVMAKEMEENLMQTDDFYTIVINKSQQYVKIDPLIREYRDTVKSYQQVVKQLIEITKGEVVDKDDLLKEFLQKD